MNKTDMYDDEKNALLIAAKKLCNIIGISSDESTLSNIVENVEGIAKIMHYPDCWDTMAYPTLLDAIKESAYPCTSCDQTGNCDKEKQ